MDERVDPENVQTLERVCEVCGPAERALSEFATAELVDELAAREGVGASYADAGARVSVDARGPATVIVVRHDRPEGLAARPRPPREG